MKLLYTAWNFVSKHGIESFLILLLIGGIVYLFYIMMDEDKSSLFRSKFYKLLRSFSNKREYDKKYIANDIKGRLNLARREIYCGEVILPKAIDVEWVDGQDLSSYEVKEGKFIVRLDPSTEQEQNIVHLARAIVKRTSLIGVRHIVEQPIKESIDLNLTKRILKECRNDESVTWFYKNIFQPISEKQDKLSEWNKKIVEIDEQGLLNAFLLVEIEDFSRRISGMEPRPYMITAISDLVRFVHDVFTRKQGEKGDLEYSRAHIRVAIILVARVDTVLNRGIDPYIDAAKIIMKKNYNTIYVIIWGKPHLRIYRPGDHVIYKRRCNKLIKSIAKLPKIYKSLEVDKYTYIDPNGRKASGRLVRFSINPASHLECKV